MLDIDKSRPLKRLAQLRDLIAAVKGAAPTDEDDWIEWKIALDIDPDVGLDDHVGQGQVARHILGLANRDPDHASRTAGGYGYLLVGVEPGECPGIDPIDPADLDPRIQKFLDDETGPTWQPQWVDYEDAHVLVVIVDPPQQGDPVHTLQKQFAKYQAGEIFVRLKGRTELRRPSDVRRLVARQAAGAASSRLTVEVVNADGNAPPTVTPLDASDEAIQPWLDDEQSDLLSALKEKMDLPPRWHTGAATAFGSVKRFVEDGRSHDEYRSEVAEYIDLARGRALGIAIKRHVASGVARLALALTNPTDHPFRDVRVTLYIPGEGVGAFTDTLHDIPADRLPRRPRRWGPRIEDRTLGFAFPQPVKTPAMPTVTPYVPTVEIDNSGSTRLSYLLVSLGPRDTVPLDVAHLVANHAHAGTQLTGEWEARSTHVSGVARGTITINVAEHPVAAHTLLAHDPDD